MARERMETVESEAPAAKRARGLEPDRSATRVGEPLLARARLLLSLQQKAGNRAVSRLVQRWREGSKADGLPKGSPVPVQRQGPEEEEEPLQGRFEPVQLQGPEEEEEPLQGRFEPAQLQAPEEEELQLKAAPAAPAPAQHEPTSSPRRNDTGLPDGLKSGVESLSGISLDDVDVHYNSAQPARLNALAYTQGSEIHVAPGQERHLPHEAWHVVQQAQGRVQPTTQLQDVPVNDDEGLEQEADAMGAKASAIAAQRQPAQLQRAFGRFAPGRPPVQRVLAHNQPIVAAEVASVQQAGGKLVFILDGGAHGQVVVKFETFGATESLAQYGDRSAALRSIAAGVLQNVPGSSALTAADMTAIAQIPAAVGGDLAFLKSMAAGVLAGSQGYDRLLAMKMQHVNVGQNLQDLVTAAAGPALAVAGAAPVPALAGGGRARARPAAAPARPAAVIPANSPLWGEFGKMAAFDLLVSNNDRFSPTGVNLENIDLHGAQGVSLDVVDPNSPLLGTERWEGEAEFRAPAAWAQARVGELCDALHINPLYFAQVLAAFTAGFVAAKTQLKAQEGNYRGLGQLLGGHGQPARPVARQGDRCSFAQDLTTAFRVRAGRRID